MPRRRTGWTAVVTATLICLSTWLSIHPARPILGTADIYTHLTVARHLVRGEGFQNDVTYPLSFAFPFARHLPQPLITRQPAFAMLLTIPYLTARGDPGRTLVHVRWLQIVFLGLLILVGLRALQTHQRPLGVLPWLALVLAGKLLAYAVDWGFVELLTGLLLLVMWLRQRKDAATAPSYRDGLLWGLLVLLRLDLCWVPLLWWWGPSQHRSAHRPPRLLPVLIGALLIAGPWLARNIVVTGHPFFTLQAQAELVKDTRSWPQYSVYRQLTPQPALSALRHDTMPILRKTARGLRFFGREGAQFFPPLLLLAFAGHLASVLWRRIRRGRWPAPTNTPPALVTSTLLLLCCQYAFFDHSLRHLLVIWPILAWETAFIAGRHWSTAALAALMSVIPPVALPGWENAARQAAAQAQTQPWLVPAQEISNTEIYFFDYSAGPWFLDRPGVWRSPAARALIPQLLAPDRTKSGVPKEQP